MGQTWQEFSEASGGDSVYDALLYQRNRTDTLATLFSGTGEPSTPEPEDGSPWMDTSTGAKALKVYIDSDWREICTVGYTELPTASLADDAVTQAKVADNAIGTAQILATSVTVAELADDAVEEDKIKDANVTAAKLANNAVETAKIKDLNVTAAKLADDSVITAKILNLNVTEGKLADDAVVTAKIKDAAVTKAKLASDAIGSWSVLSKSANYTASASDFIVASVSTSWTLTLPASPSANDRVAVYLDSITASSSLDLTVDGGTKNIGQYGTSVKLYVQGDRLELIYSGSKWVIVGGSLVPHLCQISLDGMTRSAPGSSFQSIAFDTADHDVGQLANLSSNRIDVRRTARYRVGFQAAFGQVGPTGHVFKVLKNGSALTPQITWDNGSDYYADSTTDLVGPSWDRYYSLTAGDYLELQFYGYLQSTAANEALLFVEEKHES